MSIKGQKTKSEHIPWEQFEMLLLKLERDNEIRFLLLFTFGVYTALRIGDIKTVTWGQILDKDYLELIEQKTKKYRKIPYHPKIRDTFKKHYQGQPLTEPVFKGNSSDGLMSTQYINRKIKQLLDRYNIKGKFSSHTFRKTFARGLWSKHGESERALIILGEILNHASLKTTKIYLNISDKEIKEAYMSL